MSDTDPREGERCPQCGTPVEVTEVTPHEEVHETELVLRCANGHEIRVSRHEDAEPGDGPGAAP